jgi:hypothetical protein
VKWEDLFIVSKVYMTHLEGHFDLRQVEVTDVVSTKNAYQPFLSVYTSPAFFVSVFITSLKASVHTLVLVCGRHCCCPTPLSWFSYSEDGSTETFSALDLPFPVSVIHLPSGKQRERKG